MVCLVARIPLRLLTGVGTRRQQVRGIGSSHLSEFIIPKTGRRSVKPLPIPAELNEPGVTSLACNLDIPSRVRSSRIETSPAYHRWFQTTGSAAERSILKTNRLKEEGGSSLVPLEYLGVDPSSGNFTFKRFQAPLATFASFVEAPSKNFNLYLAQCDFTSLPESLQKDLDFFPRFLRKYSSERHIYGRNIWIGTPPTYTPLHRDPNHNYFHQLAGSKKVRIMSPDTGLKVYSKLMGDKSNDWAVDADPTGKIRNEEMMFSSQRQDLYRAVWENQDPDIDIFEGEISRGQCLFIPAGWWHSFKSENINMISASVSTSVTSKKDFELLHGTDEWNQVNYWFKFETRNVGALRDLAARRRECIKLMKSLARQEKITLTDITPSLSLNACIQAIGAIEDEKGWKRGSILGEHGLQVQRAQRDLGAAMRKWGYRRTQTEELQTLDKRGGAKPPKLANRLARRRC